MQCNLSSTFKSNSKWKVVKPAVTHFTFYKSTKIKNSKYWKRRGDSNYAPFRNVIVLVKEKRRRKTLGLTMEELIELGLRCFMSSVSKQVFHVWSQINNSNYAASRNEELKCQTQAY